MTEAAEVQKQEINELSLRIPESNKPRVVIVGGGFAGIRIARTLRRANVQVVMFDRYNYHTFQPLLYQVATAGLEPDSIAGPLRKVFERQKNFYFRMAKVTHISPEKQQIETSIGAMHYDYLVLANGTKTNFFGNNTLKENAYALKQLPQALDLRHHILENFEKAALVRDLEEQSALMNVVVVGGGPTGVEVAGALGELKLHVLPHDYPELDFRKMRIHLVEAGSGLLSGMSDKSGAGALKYLEKFSVEVWLNTTLDTYDKKTAVLSNGTQIPTRTLIWAAGVTGSPIPGLDKAEIVRGNRLRTDEFHCVVGYEKIFAVGDIAGIISEENPNGHPMLAPVAIQQGENFASNLIREQKGKTPKPFSYKDKGSMATVGRNRAVVDLPGLKFKGFAAWFVWLFVHLMSIVGFRNKIMILTNWIWNYFTYDRATRLIMRPFMKGKMDEDF